MVKINARRSVTDVRVKPVANRPLIWCFIVQLWDLRKMSSTTDVRALSSRPSFDFDYRWQTYPGSEQPPTRHPHDASVMTYRGHSVLQTLIRCNFSPAETTAQKYLYSGSADGKVYIYDVLSGEIVSVLSGHTGTVRDVSWHPKLPLLASASFDKHVSLWGYKEEKQVLDRTRTLGRRRNQLRCRAANRRRRALLKPASQQDDSLPTEQSVPSMSSPPSTRGRRRTGLFDEYGTAVATAAGVSEAALLYESDDFDEGDPSCDTKMTVAQLMKLAREELDTDEDEELLNAPEPERSEQDMSPQQMLSIMRAIAAQLRNARAHGAADPSDDSDGDDGDDYVDDGEDDEDEDDDDAEEEEQDDDQRHED
jgi:hypothetical protein